MQKSKQTEQITLSFMKSLIGIKLPLIKTIKKGYALYFLIDTGANKNYIRQDFLDLDELNMDTTILDEKDEYHGIDNVSHKTLTCTFRFFIDSNEYVENFQIIEDGSALIFPTTGDSPLHVIGILGTPFLSRYNAVMNFASAEISFMSTEKSILQQS